jgi:hypothetical protein
MCLQRFSAEDQRATFPITGSDVIEKVLFDGDREFIYINDEQYFGEVSAEVWNFYVGGYQVLDKYLKARIGRTLTRQEMEEVLNMVGIIRETMEIQLEIDLIYDQVEENLFAYRDAPIQSPLFLNDEEN